MKSKIENKPFEQGELVFCIDKSVYSQHLTKRKAYQILEIGIASKAGKLKIQGDSTRIVWISDLHFSKINHPNIKKVKLDDVVENPKNDYIEITVIFEDSSKGWFVATTSKFIKIQVSTNNHFFLGGKIVVINEISKEIIESVIHQLDKSNKLNEILVPM